LAYSAAHLALCCASKLSRHQSCTTCTLPRLARSSKQPGRSYTKILAKQFCQTLRVELNSALICDVTIKQKLIGAIIMGKGLLTTLKNKPTTSITLCFVFYLVLSLILSPIRSTNELHYLSVTWQMYVSHNYLVPMQSFAPYAQKPPLLFWLITGIWHLFGVGTAGPRIVLSLFALASILLTGRMAAKLFPEKKAIALIASTVLLTSAAWFYDMTAIRFDILFSFFTLVIMYSLLRRFMQSKHHIAHSWVLAIAPALATLTKGPVFFIFILPFLLLCFLTFKNNQGKRQTKIALASLALLLLSLLFSLGWVIPACIVGGKEYADMLLLGNSVGRAAGTLTPPGSHAFFYYFYSLPGYMLPWTVFIVFGFKRIHLNKIFYLVFASALTSIVILSFVSQKADRYLLPLLPILSIVVAYILCQYNNPRRASKIAAGIFLLLSLLTFAISLMPSRHMPLLLQHINHPIYLLFSLFAFVGFMFFGLKKFSRLENFYMSFLWCFAIYASAIYIETVHSGYEHHNIPYIAKNIHEKENQGYAIAMQGSESLLDFYSRSVTPIQLVPKHGESAQWKRKYSKYCFVHAARNDHATYYQLFCEDNGETTFKLRDLEN
jgi:4-amino-4-deoxy-L-arabinose transferase-like glycosyltransferase